MKLLTSLFVLASLSSSSLLASVGPGEMYCELISQAPKENRTQKSFIINMEEEEQVVEASISGANFRIQYNRIPVKFGANQANLSFEIETSHFSYARLEVFKTNTLGLTSFKSGWVVDNKDLPSEMRYTAYCAFENK